MKKWILGLAALVLVVAAIVAMVINWISPITAGADRFFTSIREGNAQAAYRSTTREFQAATSERSFMDMLKTSTIGDYDSATWSSRSISGNTGELEGSIITRRGGVIPLRVRLVNESGEWRVHALERVPAGLMVDAAAPGIPAEGELAAMANRSVLQLARAVKTDDFSEFYGSIARLWRIQTTTEALRDAFKPLADRKNELTAIEGMAPEFTDKAVIDDCDQLVLAGRYRITPVAAVFKLKFAFEEGQWRLRRISVFPEDTAGLSVSAPVGVEMPSDSELAALANSSLMLLATALSRDDFSDFYAAVAGLWQGQTTKEKLRDQFRVFTEKKISLALVEGAVPIFTEKPIVDSNRVLLLVGHYATRPYRVEFRLKFVREESQWKLVGIDVSTTSQWQTVPAPRIKLWFQQSGHGAQEDVPKMILCAFAS